MLPFRPLLHQHPLVPRWLSYKPSLLMLGPRRAIVASKSELELVTSLIGLVIRMQLLGPDGVGGLLVGTVVTGFLLAVMMANAGGSWDNAKKYIESGQYGGKGSDAHKAGVVGDTVGDPFKDTSGPSLNILIKLISMVSIVFSSVIVTLSIIK